MTADLLVETMQVVRPWSSICEWGGGGGEEEKHLILEFFTQQIYISKKWQ